MIFIKITLIHPPISSDFEVMPSKLQRFYYREGLLTPPLGILYIASVLKNAGHDVFLIDANIHSITTDKIIHTIKQQKPTIVGVSILSHAFRDAISLIKKIHNEMPQIRIIVGGYHIELYPELTMENKEIEVGVIGQAEGIIAELVEKMEKHEDLSTIKGIIFKNFDGKVIKTEERTQSIKLDEIPFPARELLNLDDYTTFFSSHNQRVTSLLISRGCPFNCLYCSEKMYPYRYRSVENIIQEIELCINKFDIQEFYFNDSTFTVNKKLVLELCDQILSHNLKIRFNIRTRTDCIDEELLSALKKAGCDRIHYGIESGNDQVLKNLNKGTNIEEIREKIALTRKYDIHVWAFFMMGNLGDTKETMEQTLRLAIELDPDYIQINRLSPFPGTVLHKMYNERYGYDIWEDYFRFKSDSKDFQMLDSDFSTEEIDRIIRKAYRKFYYRFRYIWKRIRELNSFGSLIRYIKAAFSLI